MNTLSSIFSKVLVLAAHPDDEVLGCGGTIARLVAEGADVHIIFFTDGIGARHTKERSVEIVVKSSIRREAAQLVMKILGAKSVTFGDFPDNCMDSVALLDIIQFIETQINKYAPSAIFTHSAIDLNVDHRLVHQAAVTASRPQPGQCVQTLLFFEVPSSTEWQTPASAPMYCAKLVCRYHAVYGKTRKCFKSIC